MTPYREKVIADCLRLLHGDHPSIDAPAEGLPYFAVGERWFFRKADALATSGGGNIVHGEPPGTGRSRKPVVTPWARGAGGLGH